MGTAAASRAAGSVMPASRSLARPGSGRPGTADGGPVISLTAGKTGAEQVSCGVTARSRRGTAGRAAIRRHHEWRGPAGGEGRTPRGFQAFQPGKRPAGRARYTPAAARPRPAAMCHPVAVVRMAGMTIVVLSAGPAAFPVLP
jgi:hypothetical protein